MLKDKKILLAVCGSISFYKAYEILSNLKKLNANVRVMLSEGVMKFCTPLGFEALTSEPVLCSQSEDWQKGVSHIQYAKVDLILIAPASANTINSLANGIANSVFIQTLLASKAPILLAPAANHNMLEHFSTQKSLEFLKKNGVNIVEPQGKILACGDFGKGALAEISSIIYEVKRILSKQFFKGKKVVITGGATSENIDAVRAITNHSSGKMSLALADAFYYAGAEVVLITSIKYANLPYKVLNFKDSKTLLELSQNECNKADYFVMSAAVSDYVYKNKSDKKLKKDEIGEVWNLELHQNIDILKSLENFSVKKIGFKLELDEKNGLENAKKMLKSKNLDAVCLNIIGEDNQIGENKNEIYFIRDEYTKLLSLDTKENIALKIVELAQAI